MANIWGIKVRLFSEDDAGGFGDLGRGDRMAHAGVDAFDDICIHFLKEYGGFVDAVQGYMWIGVAGADEDGCSAEVTGIALRKEAITDETTGKSCDTAIADSIAGHVFERQTGAL